MTHFLLILFIVHLLAFGALWWRKRTGRYLRLTLLFAALVAHYALRVAEVDPMVGGVDVVALLRAFAWTLAAWSLIDLVRRRLLTRKESS